MLLSNYKENFSYITLTQSYTIPQNAFLIFASLGEECLTLALKGRCQNQMKRRQTGPERLLDNVWLLGGSLRGGAISTGSGTRVVERATGGLCEVHFLPLVVEVGDSNRTQILRCVGKSSACYTACFYLFIVFDTAECDIISQCHSYRFCMLSLLRGACIVGLLSH